MDSETLKIILNLQEENIMLKRAIDGAMHLLVKRQILEVPGIYDLEKMPISKALFLVVRDIINDFNKNTK